MTSRASNGVPFSCRVGVALLMLALAGAGTGQTPVPFIAKAMKGVACVEPTPVIRRDHMKFLTHQRDDTVHQGIRTRRHSLIGCIDCHAAKDDAGGWIPVNAPGQFCASCHEYVSAKLDCFGCHATVPASASAAP